MQMPRKEDFEPYRLFVRMLDLHRKPIECLPVQEAKYEVKTVGGMPLSTGYARVAWAAPEDCEPALYEFLDEHGTHLECWALNGEPPEEAVPVYVCQGDTIELTFD